MSITSFSLLQVVEGFLGHPVETKWVLLGDLATVIQTKENAI